MRVCLKFTFLWMLRMSNLTPPSASIVDPDRHSCRGTSCWPTGHASHCQGDQYLSLARLLYCPFPPSLTTKPTWWWPTSSCSHIHQPPPQTNRSSPSPTQRGTVIVTVRMLSQALHIMIQALAMEYSLHIFVGGGHLPPTCRGPCRW